MPSGDALTHIANLDQLVGIQSGSTVSRAVLKGQGTRVVLFSFDQGQELTEHTATLPILVQVLTGSIEFRTGDNVVTLEPGGIVHLVAGAPHALRAVEPSVMVLIMLDPRQDGSTR